MGLENQGAKPNGKIGRVIGQMMNQFHTSLYISYFNTKKRLNNARILDIGCGGGKFLNYLAKQNEGYLLWGLDHSQEMISLSEKLNKTEIENGKLTLLCSPVSKIDIKGNSLDLVTAFETIQFWPDIDMALSEIYRVLNNGGEFLIINRYPKEGTRWWHKANLKSNNDYKIVLERAGFVNTSTDFGFKKGWIIVKSRKL